METPAKYESPHSPGRRSLDDSATPLPIRTALVDAIEAYTVAVGAGWRPETWIDSTLAGELCEQVAHARLMIEGLRDKQTPGHGADCACMGCVYLRVAALYDTLPEPYQRLVQTCQEEAERRLDRTLTPEEAAEVLRVNPQTVYRNLRAGKLPGGKVGTNWRIARSDLEEYLRFGGLPGHSRPQNQWKVWSWVPTTPDSPAFWYEECNCRNQVDADTVKGLFEKAHPFIPYRASQVKPADSPAEGG